MPTVPYYVPYHWTRQYFFSRKIPDQAIVHLSLSKYLCDFESRRVIMGVTILG